MSFKHSSRGTIYIGEIVALSRNHHYVNHRRNHKMKYDMTHSIIDAVTMLTQIMLC